MLTERGYTLAQRSEILDKLNTMITYYEIEGELLPENEDMVTQHIITHLNLHQIRDFFNIFLNAIEEKGSVYHF